MAAPSSSQKKTSDGPNLLASKEALKKTLKDSLKDKFSSAFVSSDQLRHQQKVGLPSGCVPLDQFLASQGLPRGEISLLISRPGSGGTSFCLQLLRLNLPELGYASWISSKAQLFAPHLVQTQIDLRRILIVRRPEKVRSFFWILEEVLAADVFGCLICHLEDQPLSLRQFVKLKRLARQKQVALIFLVSQPLRCPLDEFAVVLEFSYRQITVLRALHRLTPFVIETSSLPPSMLAVLTGKALPVLEGGNR